MQFLNRILVLVLCQLALWGAGPSNAQTVRIGFIAPLTGGSSDFGNSAKYGAELAVTDRRADAPGPRRMEVSPTLRAANSR